MQIGGVAVGKSTAAAAVSELFPPGQVEVVATDGFLALDMRVSVNGDEIGQDLLSNMGWPFEELISFHGGLGGPQTEPFILHPGRLRMPDDAVVATYREHGHALLKGMSARSVMAEMFGRVTGCCRGRAASIGWASIAAPIYTE